MASPIAQFQVWDHAKGLAKKIQYDEALALYRSVEAEMKNLHTWRTAKTERDNLLDQAMFFGDYCGALAAKGLYADAREKGDLALQFIEKGNFSTLKYIYYNIGNLYLFQQDYAQACQWYEIALKGVKSFYTKTNKYLVNYGIALFFLEQYDKATEKFELAIKAGKGTKYNNSFEPFFYMSKICQMQNDEKGSDRYRKMYLTRLKKCAETEIEWKISTMNGGEEQFKEEILKDYAGN